MASSRAARQTATTLAINPRQHAVAERFTDKTPSSHTGEIKGTRPHQFTCCTTSGARTERQQSGWQGPTEEANRVRWAQKDTVTHADLPPPPPGPQPPTSDDQPETEAAPGDVRSEKQCRGTREKPEISWTAASRKACWTLQNKKTKECSAVELARTV